MSLLPHTSTKVNSRILTLLTVMVVVRAVVVIVPNIVIVTMMIFPIKAQMYQLSRAGDAIFVHDEEQVVPRRRNSWEARRLDFHFSMVLLLEP